jgi:glycosyltransferase involved in cell wall biosynthesis
MRICQALPGQATYSHPYLQDHGRLLPGTVTPLVCTWAPEWLQGERPALQAPGVPASARRAALAALRAAARFYHGSVLPRRLRRFDVVLAEFGTTAAAIRESCARSRVPLVAHFHGRDAFHRPTVEAHAAAYRRLFADAAAIVSVSSAMTRRLTELGAPAGKVCQIPCGADTAIFCGADPAAAPPTFAAASRFVDKKAPETTVAAFARLLQRAPEARLRFAGAGPLLASCRRLASALGISHAVEFAEALDRAEMARLLRGARAFVQHSVTDPEGDSEGMPVAVLEAASSGLPVVSTRHAGIVEAVEEGVTGFLVDEHDAAGMAERMALLAADPAEAARMGAEGRRLVERRFSLARSIGALGALLAESAARKRE